MIRQPISCIFDPLFNLLYRLNQLSNQTSSGINYLHGRPISVETDSGDMYLRQKMIEMIERLGCQIVQPEQAEVCILISNMYIEATWDNKVTVVPKYPNDDFSIKLFLGLLATTISSAVD